MYRNPTKRTIALKLGIFWKLISLEIYLYTIIQETHENTNVGTNEFHLYPYASILKAIVIEQITEHS